MTVEGVRIHAVDSAAEIGRPDGRAIVLIHGAGLDHRDWTFGFLHRLDRSWRVLAFDRPGFGGSERPSGMASALPATQARLLHAAARELGVDHAVIVGHSWGGAVAMGWGLEAPETVAGIVSLAGALTPWSLAVTMDNARRLQAAARQALGSGGLRAAAVSALADSFDPDDIPAGYIDHVRTDLGG
ncbi:MAG: alpha/beta fold hydrolase, partial [Pseudomonadota bacterium]